MRKVEEESKIQDAFFQDFCNSVFALDRHIRFVGLANREGHILGVKYPKGKSPLMSDINTERGFFAQVMQVELYHRVNKIAGKLRYHIGTFENLYAASIPISFNPKERMFIVMSLDLESNPVRVIEDKVLPLIHKNKDYLV